MKQKDNSPRCHRETLLTLLLTSIFFLSSISCVGATSITPKKIEAILNSYLASRKVDLPEAEIRFKKIYLPKTFVIPDGRFNYEIFPSNQKIIGNGRFTIIFKVDGQGAVKNIPVRAEVEAIKPIAVTTRNLKRGHILTAEDLKIVKRDIAKLRNPCSNLKDVVGQKITRNIRANTPLSRDRIDFPPVVKRGENVMVLVRTQSLQLKAKGIAHQNGKQDELIKIRNTNSHKEFLGRVIAPGIVEVTL